MPTVTRTPEAPKQDNKCPHDDDDEIRSSWDSWSKEDVADEPCRSRRPPKFRQRRPAPSRSSGKRSFFWEDANLSKKCGHKWNLMTVERLLTRTKYLMKRQKPQRGSADYQVHLSNMTSAPWNLPYVYSWTAK